MEVAILAGGLGTRLRSVVSEVPKCMAPVAGRPFLWYLLEQLRGYRVSRVILSVGYLRDVIMDWVSEHAREYPFEFRFAVEEQPLGTGGGIRLATSEAAGKELIVLNGDTFFDADLEALLEARRRSSAAVALALKPMSRFERYGAVDIAPDGTVTAFNEKRFRETGLINGGVYAMDLESDIFDGLGEKFSFEKSVLEVQCARGRLTSLVQDGYFIDIGIPGDYARADASPELLEPSHSLLSIVSSLRGFDTLLLDRDGVINRLRPGDYVKEISEFDWLPGVKEALAAAAGKFRNIFIVTNQRGVGRGLMSEAALGNIHSWMVSEIEAAGGRIDGIYCCTSTDSSDPMRKPRRGMFDALLSDHPDVAPSSTIMLGDSPSDREFAVNCGISFRYCCASG